MFAVCNRTYYGDVGRTYTIQVPTPQWNRIPFLCHLTFTASGHEQGDIVQVSVKTFRLLLVLIGNFALCLFRTKFSVFFFCSPKSPTNGRELFYLFKTFFPMLMLWCLHTLSRIFPHYLIDFFDSAGFVINFFSMLFALFPFIRRKFIKIIENFCAEVKHVCLSSLKSCVRK